MSQPVIIFDNACSLCRQFTRFLQHWDSEKRFQYRPLQDEKLYKEFPQLSREACEQSMHFVDADGAVYAGIDIVEPLRAYFPKIRAITWMLGLPGVRTVTDVLYDLVAVNRKRISKLCPRCVKTPE